MESSSLTVNKFSTDLLHPQRSPALNIPCVTGVRLPNLTDCTRYYTCNSTSHTIFSYTCPSQMAFNVHRHVCEADVYKWCKKQITNNQPIISQPTEAITLVTTPNSITCSTTGKIPDPESSQHYFVCYPQSDKIVRYRMSCPNTLHYCTSQEVCKKQRDCYV